MASTWVYDVNEAGGACTGATPPANQLDLDGVVFCNSALNVLKGYQVVADADGDHGTLQELVNGAWADMTVGGSPVKVTFNPGQPAGGETVDAGRPTQKIFDLERSPNDGRLRGRFWTSGRTSGNNEAKECFCP